MDTQDLTAACPKCSSSRIAHWYPALVGYPVEWVHRDGDRLLTVEADDAPLIDHPDGEDIGIGCHDCDWLGDVVDLVLTQLVPRPCLAARTPHGC